MRKITYIIRETGRVGVRESLQYTLGLGGGGVEEPETEGAWVVGSEGRERWKEGKTDKKAP